MRHAGIEFGRVVAFIFVVVIHVNALGFWGNAEMAGFLTDEASRFAVPLFFMISGYFWKDKSFESPALQLINLAWRLGIPMIFWVALYLVLEYSELLYPRSYYRSALGNLLIPLSGGPGMHLWFLPALFIGTALSLFGIRLLGYFRFLWISVGLLVCGIMLGTYAHLFHLSLQNVFYRNGLFFAPFFLAAGYTLAKRGWTFGAASTLALVCLGYALHVFEGYFVNDRFPMGHDFSFGTVPFAIGVFAFFAQLNIRPGHLANLGSLTLGAYLVHLLVLKFAAHVIVDRGPVVALFVAIATVAISLTIAGIMKRLPFVRHLV
ncbi:Surface polysaccharide O-acyltransferase, integral membrane enzyme [Rhizobium sp. RU20A]|uniref:acyltransferase n=1 Tax=Rhizobium sp. RU20A TaxID=1907412 RepID=UPI000954408A|nr:acyltransferase family protein [Rhizobium sp. RU20A]SIR11291.1 Surface polysaccharide O-acyltransferase, integral membrane enzyme [Rhizobium sp. RU20A]